MVSAKTEMKYLPDGFRLICGIDDSPFDLAAFSKTNEAEFGQFNFVSNHSDISIRMFSRVGLDRILFSI